MVTWLGFGRKPKNQDKIEPKAEIAEDSQSKTNDSRRSRLTSPNGTAITGTNLDRKYHYTNSAITRHAIDDIVKSSFKKGYEIKSDDDAVVKTIEKGIKAFHVEHVLRQATIAARLYGGSTILTNVRTSTYNNHLNHVGEGRLKGFSVFTPITIFGMGGVILDPLSPYYLRYKEYQPIGSRELIDPSYLIFLTNGKMVDDYYTMSGGDPILNIINGSNGLQYRTDDIQNHWGNPAITTSAMRDIAAYESTIDAVPDLIKKSTQDILKIKGLKGMVSDSATVNSAYKKDPIKIVSEKIANIDEIKRNFRTTAIDADDELDRIQSTLTGAADLIQELQYNVAGQVGIPASILFSRNASGLGANNEADISIYNNRVEECQSEVINPALEKIVTAIAQNAGIPDDAYDIEWLPIQSNTEQEQAVIDTAKTDMITSLVNTGVISMEDANKIASRELTIGVEEMTDEEIEFSGTDEDPESSGADDE